MKILIGSNNLGKVEEYSALLGSNFDPVSLSSIGLELDVDENGATYEENALIKLNYLKSRCELPIITDDSGLEVNFLEGRPGMYSARYSGDNATDDSNIEKLLNELNAFQMQSKFPLKENHARFVCTIAYFDPSSSDIVITSTGDCQGQILSSRRGAGGFGYDPIFYFKELGKTFAELSAEEKNTISHRSEAVKNLLKRINI
jgi:XTP/dITP diphosphohydrolase